MQPGVRMSFLSVKRYSVNVCSERLNIQIDNGQTIYDKRILDQKLMMCLLYVG